MEAGRRLIAQPRLESLEDRTLMASQLAASLSGGVLRIEGTAKDDVIQVRQLNNRISIDNVPIQLKGQGKVSSVKASSITRIIVRAHGGHDRVILGGEATRGANALTVPVVVWGGTGNDVIRGGQGKDQLYGELGRDHLQGRGGQDALNGGSGNDRLDGGKGADILRGGNGNDYLRGGLGNDLLEGGAGNDQLFAGVGNDTLHGGSGVNLLSGESGNDQIHSSSGLDTVFGGPGQDQILFTEGASQRTGRVNTVEVFGNSGQSDPSGAFREEVQQLIALTNAYRTQKGLDALKIDARLTEAAQYQADYMARTGLYTHINEDGRNVGDRAQAAGYSFRFVAENIHMYDPEVRRSLGVDRTYGLDELASYFFDGWKASRSHNENLLSQIPRDIGVALAQDAQGRIFAVQVFGKQ